MEGKTLYKKGKVETLEFYVLRGGGGLADDGALAEGAAYPGPGEAAAGKMHVQ